MNKDIQDDPSYREIAQYFSDSASGYIRLFSKKYFGKELEDLTNKEKDTLKRLIK